MRIRRTLALSVLALVGCATFVGYADPSVAATIPAANATITCGTSTGCVQLNMTANSSGAVGNPGRYSRFVEKQTTIDCVPQAALVAMSAIDGLWVASRKGIDAEAQKLGVYSPTAGGQFSSVNDKLFAHYGFKATVPKSLSRKTVMADLSKGDSIQVAAYAGYLWQGVPVPGHPNEMWVDNSAVSPDHSVVVDAVNKSTYAVTISDTGVGMTYTIPWAQFARAWATGGYDGIVISK